MRNKCRLTGVGPEINKPCKSRQQLQGEGRNKYVLRWSNSYSLAHHTGISPTSFRQRSLSLALFGMFVRGFKRSQWSNMNVEG